MQISSNKKLNKMSTETKTIPDEPHSIIMWRIKEYNKRMLSELNRLKKNLSHE